MIGLFNKTGKLYDALGDETRLSILILLRAKKEMNLEVLTYYLGEENKETLEYHLSILEETKLIQKKDSNYSLTKEGTRRLSELRVTESEAIELTKERELSIKSAQNEVDSVILDDRTFLEVEPEIQEKILALLNDENSDIRLKALDYLTAIVKRDSGIPVLVKEETNSQKESQR